MEVAKVFNCYFCLAVDKGSMILDLSLTGVGVERYSDLGEIEGRGGLLSCEHELD